MAMCPQPFVIFFPTRLVVLAAVLLARPSNLARAAMQVGPDGDVHILTTADSHEEAQHQDHLAMGVDPDGQVKQKLMRRQKRSQVLSADLSMQAPVGGLNKIRNMPHKAERLTKDAEMFLIKFQVRDDLGATWVALPPEVDSTSQSQEVKALGTVLYHGSYRDLSLWEQSATVTHRQHEDGLWVLEYISQQQMDKEHDRALKHENITVLITRALSAVVQGDVTKYLGYDTCGDQHDEFGLMNVISVPDDPVLVKHLSQAEVDNAMKALGKDVDAKLCGSGANLSAQLQASCKKIETDQSFFVREFNALDKATRLKTICEPTLSAQLTEDSIAGVITTLQGFNSRNSYSGSQSNSLTQALTWAQDRLSSYGYTVTRHAVDGYSSYPTQIVAEMTGRIPTSYVVLGAHFDDRNYNRYSSSDRAPGADDNGSGSAAVLEIARILKDRSHDFLYTIRICLFTGEEQGLLGSRSLAAKWKSNGDNIVAMYNADMIGYLRPGQPKKVAFMDGKTDQSLVELSMVMTQLCVPELQVAYTSACCSDHQSFYENGFPAVTFFETSDGLFYPQYHSSDDLLVYLDKEIILLRTKSVFASLILFLIAWF